MHIVYFHRNRAAGYSIHKVTQTVIRDIEDREEHELPYSGPSPLAIIRNLWFVYRHRRKDAINHVTGDVQYAILALGRCKSVLTCHDTVSLDFRRMSFLNRVFFEWIWYRFPLKRATKIVAISENTRKCLQRYTNRKDIEVIHNAIDPIFVRKDRPHHEVPQILLIGTSPNKNLVRTFKALKGLKCQVNIIGALSEEQIASLKENQLVYTNRTGLSDAEIVEAYAQCDMVSFVSLFEGFGMIVVEANQVGRPVICSDIPVLREVGGDAALFVNPTDVAEMHAGFERIISNVGLQEELVARGFENAKRFDVVPIQQQWRVFYESLVK